LGARDFAPPVPFKGDTVSDMSMGPRPASTNGLARINAFAALDTIQNFGLFGVTICWYERDDRLANYVVGSVAEYSRGSIVPAGDNAIDVFGHDRII
jgi:hypothetical protein